VTSPASTPLEPWPLADPLDAYLREVVQTLHAAVNQGMRHAADDPRAAARPIQDCEEMLRTIMVGDVQEWLSPTSL
jgi:hypothetical protein